MDESSLDLVTVNSFSGGDWDAFAAQRIEWKLNLDLLEDDAVLLTLLYEGKSRTLTKQELIELLWRKEDEG